MNKKKIPILVLCAIMIAGIGFLAYYRIAENNRGRIYEDLQAGISLTAPETPAPVEENDTGSSSEVPPEAEPYVSEIDFEELWEINPDIYAWITIPGMDISYPIVQHPEDDTYYLNHTIEGASGRPGAIFTFSDNAKDFSRFNTIIYGHNMSAGTMFGTLKQYRDESFLQEHRQIIIYTPVAKLTYQVFAAVIYDDRLINTAFDDTVEADRQRFLDSIYGIRDLNSHILDDVEVTTDSHIITLSTCVYGQTENRYLVEAVLIDIEQ